MLQLPPQNARRAGEHWALLGANGAGKSTLLRLLGALVHPTRGTVEVLGRRLGRRVDLRELRAQVGHVDPRHPLTAPLRVRDVVLTGLTNSVAPLPRWRPTQEQRDRAFRLIGILGLGDLADARWPTLSQGQRGRTLIARALMPAPLLLLDGTSHAMLLREGRVLAQGPAPRVLTGDQVGKRFDLPLVLERHDSRWTVRIRGRA
ncbi:ATP-binding cassette domain-containing protein [Streptomyces pseudovenezuelae]|uniref:ATP-binding cassette domain-containing protein n=1 Tax=Streptomyces pseudovenezuelae TaxID=67350 RepID=UPI0034A36BD5